MQPYSHGVCFRRKVWRPRLPVRLTRPSLPPPASAVLRSWLFVESAEAGFFESVYFFVSELQALLLIVVITISASSVRILGTKKITEWCPV